MPHDGVGHLKKRRKKATASLAVQLYIDLCWVECMSLIFLYASAIRTYDSMKYDHNDVILCLSIFVGKVFN